MSWTLADAKTLVEIIQASATSIGIGVAGWWTYSRYFRHGENYPQIESAAEIEFVGEAALYWIVELRAVLQNKGKVEHRFSDLGFSLNALYAGDPVELSERWGGQVDFSHKLARGSFLPHELSFFIIGPGVTAKYSHLTRVPKEASFLILHCQFSYADRPGFTHSMEMTVRVPQLSAD